MCAVLQYVAALVGVLLPVGLPETALSDGNDANRLAWTVGKQGTDWLTSVTFEDATVRHKTLGLLNGYDPANEWWVTSGGAMRPLLSEKIKQAIRFTVPWTKNVTSVGLQTCQSMGEGSLKAKTVPTYRLGIQTDLGGHPSGKWLGSGTIMPTNGSPRHGYAQGKQWHYAKIEPQVMVEEGGIYHIVVQWESGKVDSRNYGRFYAFSTPGNDDPWLPFNTGGADPDVNYRDPNLMTLLFDSGGWQPEPNKRFTPVFMIRFADGTAHGQPYLHNHCTICAKASYEYEQPRGAYAAQVFKVHNVDKTVTHFATPVNIGGEFGRPDAHLYYDIENEGGEVLRKGILVIKPEPDSWKWREVELATPLKLQKGRSYRIVLTCPGMRGYLIEAPHQYELPGIWQGQVTEPYASTSYGGKDAYFTCPRAVGYEYKEWHRDMSFRFKLREVFKGTATSVPRTAGRGKMWRKVVFVGVVPEKTTVAIYFRAGADWRLVKANARSGVAYEIPANARGPTGQWRLMLETEDAAVTPEIEQVTMFATGRSMGAR